MVFTLRKHPKLNLRTQPFGRRIAVYCVNREVQTQRRCHMTRNQIEYFKLLETRRNNRAVEALTRARDLANYRLGSGTLAENTRHNKAAESQQYAVLGEQQRHNRAQEAQTTASLDETSRHNKALETVSALDAATRRLGLREDSRHNVAVETEQARANKAREQETQRANLASESIRRAANAITSNLGYANVAESARRNTLQYALGQDQLSEQQRSNVTREVEAERHNRSTETEAQRSNVTREIEQTRSNLASESLRGDEVAVKGLDSIGRNVTSFFRSVIPLF